MMLEVVSSTAALLDGRYLLEDRVGQGGMASVYRAEDTHLGRTVAIKMIHPGDDALGSADRAHTEKALLASLSHPSLVTLFDAQLEPHRAQYLVMEFVDGPTLADRMIEGVIPARELACVTQDVAEGLAAAHSAGIVHRDVKPSNVLMSLTSGRSDRSWCAKLADFGIACTLNSSRVTSPGIVLGTLTYMAPEQLRGADPETATDVFSLGLVVLEALTGGPGYPAIGSDRAAALTRLASPPSIPETVDEKWRDLLEQMTRLEPSERPSADAVARAARDLSRRDSTGATAPQFVAPRTDSAVLGTHPTRASTKATAVLPAMLVRRAAKRALLAAGGLAVAVGLVAGIATLSPSGSDTGRMPSSTVVRTPSEPAETVTGDTAPDATVEEPKMPVDLAVDQEDNPGRADSDKPGRSDGAKDRSSPGDQNKPDHAADPTKGKDE